MIPKTPLVVDLYHGDRVTDFAALKAAGVAGVIHKAHQGASPRGYDPTYDIRRRAARNTGLLWGAYHFMTNEDPEAQAELFLSSASPDVQTLLAVDFEPYGRRTPSLAQLRALLNAISERAGRKAVLYSGSLIKETLGPAPDEVLGSHRLWLADYADEWKLDPLTAWKRPWLWQFTGDGQGPEPHKIAGAAGAAGFVDLNRYEGSFEQLTAEWAS
jgi:lysozyme